VGALNRVFWLRNGEPVPYAKFTLDWKGRRHEQAAWRHGRREVAEEEVLDGIKIVFDTTIANVVFVHGYTRKTSPFARTLMKVDRDGPVVIYPCFYTGLFT
jgi:hypothetical protein